MHKLTLMFKDKIKQEFKFGTNKVLNIGRKNSNEIVIDDMAVSGLHAKIEQLDDGLLVTDLRSKNGTFINEQLVISQWLKNGDAIHVGKHTLVLSNNDSAGIAKENVDDLNQTIVMDTTMYQDMRAKSFLNTALGEKKKGSVGVVTFLSGKEGEVILTKKEVRIGKNASSDIIVRGFFVGKNAAVINKKPNSYYLRYLEGFFKPKVNGKAIKGSVMLNEFDIIKVGSIKMQFKYR